MRFRVSTELVGRVAYDEAADAPVGFLLCGGVPVKEHSAGALVMIAAIVFFSVRLLRTA